MKPIIKSVDLSEFKSGFNRLRGAARDEALKNTVEAGGRVIEGYAKINANGVFSSKATNTLANSITVEVEGGGTKATANIGPTVVYGRIQELGGVIKPVHAKMLHWVEDGIDFFAKMVHLTARPYLRPAADEHENEARDAMVEVLKREIGAT